MIIGCILLILCAVPLLLALFDVIPHYRYGEKALSVSVSADDAVLYQDVSLTTEAGTLAEIWEKDSTGAFPEIISYLSEMSADPDVAWTICKGERVIAHSPEKFYLKDGGEYTIILRHE